MTAITAKKATVCRTIRRDEDTDRYIFARVPTDSIAMGNGEYVWFDSAHRIGLKIPYGFAVAVGIKGRMPECCHVEARYFSHH